jgi:hypothetical protein
MQNTERQSAKHVFIGRVELIAVRPENGLIATAASRQGLAWQHSSEAFSHA